MENNNVINEKEINYLKGLQNDIFYDDDIKIYTENSSINNVSNSLEFLKELNINLLDVLDFNFRFIKVKDIETKIIPSYEKSVLMRKIYNNDQLVNRIILGNSDSNLIYGSYLHEVMHTQVHKYGYKPQIKEDYNVELLPVFIELLYAKENNNSKLIKRRINNLKEYIPNYLLYFDDYSDITLDEKQRSERYIKSFMQAMHLLDIYLNSDDINKKKIIDDINEVIINHITVEDLLKKYNVKYQNSAYDLKTLKRSI